MTEAVAEAPKIPPGRVVITQENMDAFYDEKLGIKPVAKVENTELPADESGDKPDNKGSPASAGEANHGDDDEHEEVKQARRNPKIEERFSKLSADRKAAQEKAAEALAQVEKARDEAATARAEAEALKAKYEPPKTDPLGPKPNIDQFENAEEFSKALELWTTEKVERDRATKEADERQQKEIQARVDAFRERQAAFRKDTADYDEKINGSTAQVSDAVRDAILESDVGPQLLYHFATNPDVAERIAKLSEKAALREVGKLEAKLGDPPKAEAKTPIAEVSKAPAPITPLSAGNSVPQIPVDGKGVWHGSFQDYVKARQSGKIK